MSNVETRPLEVVCKGGKQSEQVQVLSPRLVPLGEAGGMEVRRTLPQRARSLIGAWCFCDHYGPESAAATGGMDVRVHPHTGLQTASWLFAGTIEHRDSGGNHALVRPGELNLMTAGAGISHSERSTPDTDILHGVQLWTALPSNARFVERRFEHYVPPVVEGAGWNARVFLGNAFGSKSPVETYTPLLGAELSIEPGASAAPAIDDSYEIGVLVDTGAVSVEGAAAGHGTLLYLAPGRESVRITAGAEGARVLLLGGPPFGEPIVMWWNFVARSHEEIVEYRAQWEAELAGRASTTQFDQPVGDPEAPLPAPPLPDVRILPRG